MEPDPQGQPATAEESTTSREYLSWQEICARYPDEWVFLVEVEHENDDPDNGEIVRALVLAHAKGRKEIYRLSKPIIEREDIRSWAHLYTGGLSLEGICVPQWLLYVTSFPES